MKRILFLFAAVLGLVSLAFKPLEEEKYPTIELGTTIPMKDYKMLDVAGSKLSLAEIKKQKGTLVIFSCNTCPFVLEWEDRYDDIMAIANRVGVGVALVNSNEAKRDNADSYEAMQSHAKEQAYSAPYLLDENSALANAFGAKTTPHVFLFDSSDKLVYLGAIDDNSKDASQVKEKYLFDALYALNTGSEIKIAKSNAKGCSIKRLN
ncbi:MAG: thioredoxin family protein [Chitinophagales bacterium]|nr:thioredoxin family protein [Chitinophagales bacterium]